ncbi:MAG TPA: hypothetical protein VHT27_06055 [Solirubrobacteraceae bacterium]|nr:hypothetical protein [Solirubrobacteraceae bacterium]
MSRAGSSAAPKDPREKALLYRRWLMSSAIAIAEADGVAGISVARVIAAAGVSRKVFYDTFSDVEDCLGAALEQVFDSATEAIAASHRSEESWREATRAALGTLLALAEQQRALARVCVIETLRGGPRLQRLRQRAMVRAQEAIDRGAREPGARTPPALTAEALVGGIAELLRARLAANAHEPLTELTAPCMSMIVLAYLGPSAAAQELDRAAPASNRVAEWGPLLRRKPAIRGPRLTYRTVRVLDAIAEHPGSPNREVARLAGIADQGQISKLLKRLAAGTLIENHAGEQNGNAWWLTDAGREFHASIAPR